MWAEETITLTSEAIDRHKITPYSVQALQDIAFSTVVIFGAIVNRIGGCRRL